MGCCRSRASRARKQCKSGAKAEAAEQDLETGLGRPLPFPDSQLDEAPLTASSHPDLVYATGVSSPPVPPTVQCRRAVMPSYTFASPYTTFASTHVLHLCTHCDGVTGCKSGGGYTCATAGQCWVQACTTSLTCMCRLASESSLQATKSQRYLKAKGRLRKDKTAIAPVAGHCTRAHASLHAIDPYAVVL